MSDEEVAAFCEKLKSVDLVYLNLMETCPLTTNCRKYSRILESIGGGFRGDNHVRVQVLDLSYNILLGQAISQYVIPFVSELRICQHSCQSLLLQTTIPQQASMPHLDANLQLPGKKVVCIDPSFILIAD